MTLLRALQRLCSLRWRRHLWSVGVFAVFLVGRVGGKIRPTRPHPIFLPGGHRAERSLDRPSRVPQKWHFSWFPTHFPLLCCSRLSLLPHPASHWAPIFIPPLSPALVKQTGCCLPCGSLSFFFFPPPSDPLVIHFRGRQPYSSRRMQPARFICRCLSARRWPLTASDGAATAVGHIQPELYTHCRWIMPSVSK